MTQEDDVCGAIRRRSSRAITHILSIVDDINDNDLRTRLRKAVLDEINELIELSSLLVSSVACDHEDFRINEYFLDQIADLISSRG